MSNERQRRRFYFWFFSFFILHSSLCTGIHGDDLIMTLPGDAVTASMGEASRASISGAPAMFGNPAGLSRSDVGSISFMHTAYLENITYNTLAVALPFGFRNALGVGVSYLNFGSVPSYDSNGVTMPSYTPTDLCARVGVAKSFFRTSLGASVFFMQSKIVDAATAFGGSLGVHQVWGPFSWAASLENAGSALSYTESKPLPTQQRLGVSFQMFPSWMMNVEAIKPKEGSMWLGFGNEWRWELTDDVNVSLRGGYNTQEKGDLPGWNGIAGGAGFGWKDSALNYAWVPFGDLGQTHRLSFHIYFGQDSGGPTSEREHRSRSLFTPRAAPARRTIAKTKAVKAAMALPKMPWKKGGRGWRTAKDKMMTLLAQDALCSGTGARAVLTRTRGTVVMKTSEREGRWPRLRTGQYLFEGDTIRTYGNSTADVVFANGAKAQVGADSILIVKTKQDICHLSTTMLEKGQLFLSATNGNEVRVQTPLGEATVENAQIRLSVDEKAVSMRVQHGSGTFTSDGIATPVQEHTTVVRTTDGKTMKTNDVASGDTAVTITEANRNPIPGRWDERYTTKFRTEIMRLDSLPGLKLAEYVRDTSLRNELKLKVYDQLQKQEDLREQQDGLIGDVRQFEDLKKSLSQPVEGENAKAARERLRNLRQASRVLANAKKDLLRFDNTLKKSLDEVRANREFLAAMPIVRMLNITAEESVIPFESGRAVVSDSATDVLDTIAGSMLSIQPFRVVVEGHTDQSGSARSNQRLSKQRAEAVAAYLRKKTNLPARLFITKGMGATQPLQADGSSEAMEKNRRVEIWFELRGL